MKEDLDKDGVAKLLSPTTHIFISIIFLMMSIQTLQNTDWLFLDSLLFLEKIFPQFRNRFSLDFALYVYSGELC